MDFSYLDIKTTHTSESYIKNMVLNCEIVALDDDDSEIEVGSIKVIILDEGWLTKSDEWDGETLHQYAISEYYDDKIEWAFNSVNYKSELFPFHENDYNNNNSLILNGIKNKNADIGPEGKAVIYGRVAYIEEIKIKKPYRNNGIGSKAMLTLIDFLSKMCVDFVLTKPFPLEEEGVSSKEGIKKLIVFYKRFGFEITDEDIEIDNGDEPHMYLDVFNSDIVVEDEED